MDRIVRYGLSGGLPLAIFLMSLVLGVIALNYTAREEEPQIVVPMVDVLVQSPGLSVKQTERQVTVPLEKLLSQISGVEHVYSQTNAGFSSVTLRFYVGEDREEAILNTYNKLYSNQHAMPQVVSSWQVNPIEVDDVPIVMLGLYSQNASKYSDYELRRLADELANHFQSIKNTSEVKVVGGRPRTVRLLIKPESLAARQSTASDIVRALQVSNVLQQADYITLGHESLVLESGDVIRSVEELKQLVINVVNGVPVFLQDVADVHDAPAEVDSYSWIDFSEQHSAYQKGESNYPMVAISVAKKRGSNAVKVAEDVHQMAERLKGEFIPADINVEVLRDYGKTANEKVDNLASSLAFAVFTVVVFIAVFLGLRPALVVGLAVPISYGVTLALDMVFGYTINRVTLFALILSLGLLVDDPITGIDNIERFLKRKGQDVNDKIVDAISEIKVPLIMSTITIILAFIPLAFITGMMGPYMAPMAFNVPISVASSTMVAFLVTPWLARKLLKPKEVEVESEEDTTLLRYYRKLLSPLLDNRNRAKWFLWSVLVVFIVAAMLPVLRLVPLKLLPFDNKNELQVLVDMPESATLEQTAAITEKASVIIRELNEVQAVAAFVGVASPMDFNGMVRRYYQRGVPYLGELRVTLLDKTEREHQSHAVVLRLRQALNGLNKEGVLIKVVEVPPGPPVLNTLVAEVYGSTLTEYSELQQAALQLKERMKKEAFVTEVDSTVEDDFSILRFVTDKQKAALSGVSTADINQSLLMANKGLHAGILAFPRESKPLPLEVRLDIEDKASLSALRRIQLKGQPGIVKRSTSEGIEVAAQPLVSLGELGHFERQIHEKSIHHKNLKPVVYVMAEISGRTPAEVIADIHSDQNVTEKKDKDWRYRTFLNSGGGMPWQLPSDIDVVWSGEGEWSITVDVFRDMGIAFAFALVAIFFVLKIQTNSVPLSLIIMSAIPLTIIGIMPGFFLLNQFGEREVALAPDPVLFTATAMIGMIALAGIVVRNSLILVEFITQARNEGNTIKESLIKAGAVRMRPVLLTAGTTLLGNLVIILDPVFSGLALAIIFGIIASTAFTLLVVPVVYLMVFEESGENNG